MQHFKVNMIAAAVATSARGLPHRMGGLALLAGASCVSAIAAEPTTAPTDAMAAAPIETVVVSARKMLERAQDVPVAITTISADNLIQKNQVGIKDFFAEVPGLNLSAGDRGTSEVSLRGITSGPAANPTTAITIDDAPFGSSLSSMGGGTMMPDIDPADLQRIEVLRGPQGTLYGASSLGGLIKYVTAKPNTVKFSARAQVDGSHADGGGNGYGLRASVNVPVSEDMLGVRLSAYDRRDAGFITDTRQGSSDVDAVRTRGGRVSALLTPNANWTVRGSAMFQQSRAGASSSEDTDLAGTPLYGEYAHQRMPGTDGYRRDFSFMDLSVAGDLGWGTLSSLTSHGRIAYDALQDASTSLAPLMRAIGAVGAGVISSSRINSTKSTQEFRLDSPEGKHALDWRAGLFYTVERGGVAQGLNGADQATGNPINTIPLIALTDSAVVYKELAAYGTVTYHFTDRFDVQAGGRVGHSRQQYREASSGLLIGEDQDARNRSSDRAATYTITPRILFSPDLMAYTTLSTGYRPGGPNSGISVEAPRTYKSDSSQNLELGLKGDLLERRLSFSAALYHIDWKDIQLLAIDPNGLTFLQNGAAATSKGIETSFVWVPADGWRLSGNAVLNDAKLTTSLPANSVNQGKDGDRLPYSSRTTASMSLAKNFAVAPGLQGFASGGASYIGSRLGNFTAAGVQRLELAGFTAFDLQAGVKTREWSLSVFLKNLGGKHAYLGGLTRGAVNQYTVVAPRSLGLSLSRSL